MTLPSQPAVGDPITAAMLDQLIAAGTVAASGTAVVTPTAANTPTSLAVSFPVGRFTSAPVVMVTPSTTVPGTAVTGWAATNVTTTGFLLWVTRTSTTATTLMWHAVVTP